MNTKTPLLFSALLCAFCGCLSSSDPNAADETAPRVTPAWNAADPATTAKWFLENVYGVRPPAAEKPAVTFEKAEPDKVMMDGAAVRKRIRISYEGPFGRGAFVATAFIPTSKGPHPAFVLICNRSKICNTDPERIHTSDFWPAEDIVNRGYAAISFYYGDLAPDWDTGNTKGVFACYEKEGPYRSRRRWGTLSAWAWGASRVMDWIETEPTLDAKHVGVVGHSRGGKTALLTGVTDSRFAMACSNDSGCSGAKLNRADLPKSEHLRDICATFPYWFCKDYLKWINRDEEIPFDQHQFIALMAPRLVAVASATEDAWAGPAGEYEACVLASGAWEAHGKKGLVSTGFPAPATPLQEGSISYHLRSGKHNLTPYDWKCYLNFADRNGWRNH